jgi:solute carrier family 26 (sodium-independent sulfate anion transporter), member 11
MMLTPDRCLIFPSVDYVRNLVTKHGTRQGMIPVVIDCSHIYGADFTAARVSLIAILHKLSIENGNVLARAQ